jgi:hypothetical protein
VFAQVSLPEGGVASPRPRPKLVKSLSLTDRPPTRAKPLTQCMHLDEPEISVHSMTPPGDESLVVTGTSASPVRPVVVARGMCWFNLPVSAIDRSLSVATRPTFDFNCLRSAVCEKWRLDSHGNF